MASSSSFGRWYEEQQALENGDAGPSSSSWFSVDTEQMLPLFSSESLQGYSFESMKQSMESQMPKKILGMGYQQRFKVSDQMRSVQESMPHPRHPVVNTAFVISSHCMASERDKTIRYSVRFSFCRHSFLPSPSSWVFQCWR